MNMQRSSISAPDLAGNASSSEAAEADVSRMIANFHLRITRCPKGLILVFNSVAGVEAQQGTVSYVQLLNRTKPAASKVNGLTRRKETFPTPEAMLDALRSILFDRLRANAEPDDEFAILIAAAICCLSDRQQLCLNEVRSEAGGLTRWQEERAKSYMDEQLSEQITVKDVAKHCGMSASNLAHAFRVTEGLPPYRWLIKRRIDQAKKLLQFTSMALVDISMECGFAEQSHFTHAFRRDVGVAPGGWRRVHRRTPAGAGLTNSALR